MAAVSGVYAAAITPRRQGPEIDLASMFELIDFLAGAGVSGIALMGATGEFLHFSIEDRSRLVSLAVKRSRLPILAGAGHSTFDGALTLARDAADAGAAGVLVMPPSFYSYGQADIRHFYMRLAGELKGACPIYLYNIPQFASEIRPETAIDLLSTGEFAGIKDSAPSWESFAAVAEARERLGFTLLAGRDAFYLKARGIGADGIISGAASAVPELLTALDHALTARADDRAAALDASLQQFLAWLDCAPAPMVIREAVALRGLRTGPHASPPSDETRRELDVFAEWFRGWSPDVLRQCSHG